MLNPHLDDGDVRLYLADCIDAMRELPADSVDAIVTDPPYGLEFMGKEWDRPWAVTPEARVGYAGRDDLRLPSHRDNRNANCRACGGRQRGAKRCKCDAPDWDRAPSTDMHAFQSWCESWAREALRIAKPGAHLAAFGGPRTFHRLTAGIEDAGWEIRDCLAWNYGSGFPKSLNLPGGLGTALKPAWEPIILARKPLAGTVAANVLAHGTGALNIDATRIDGTKAQRGERRTALGRVNDDGWKPKPVRADDASGRWPANVVLDPEAAKLLDEQTGDLPAGVAVNRNKRGGMAAGATSAATAAGGFAHRQEAGSDVTYGDSGGASRFFYTAKADAEERVAPDGTRIGHPTLKPTDLMRWLVRLVTPPGGLVLDPFAGSGSTGVACRAEGFRCVLIEREDEYAAYIRARLSQPTLFTEECRNG